MLICPSWYFQNAPVLVLENVANRLMLLLVLLVVDTDCLKPIFLFGSKALQHRMIVSVCEDEALDSGQELSFVVFEKSSGDTTTCWVSHQAEGGCLALLASDVVLPDVLAVLCHGPTIRDVLPWDWIFRQIWVHNEYRLSSGLCEV